MAGDVIKSFLIALGYKVDKDSEKKAENSIDKIKDTVDTLRGALEALAGAWVVNEIASSITATADKFSRLAEIASRTGDSAESLGALAYASEQIGVGADVAIDAYTELSRKVGEAALGGGEGLEVFKQLGITLKDSEGKVKSTSQVWQELTNKINSLDSKELQISYIDQLSLGDDAIALFMNDLQKYQTEYVDIYKTAGVDINQAGQASAGFKESLSSLLLVITTIKDAIGLAFLDDGKATFDGLKKTILDNMPRIIEVLTSFVKGIQIVAKALMAFASLAIKIFNNVLQYIENLSTGWKIALGLMAGAWVYFNSAFLKSPIGILLSLGAAIALLVEDYKVFKEGGNSAIDWNNKFAQVLVFIAQSPIPKIIAGVGALIVLFKQFAKPVITIVSVFTKLSSVVLSLVGFALKTLITSLSILIPLIYKASSILLILARIAITALIKAIGLLTAGLIKLGIALLTTPIGWITLAIGLLIGVIYALYKNWDTVVKYFNKGVDFIKNYLGSLYDKAGAIVDNVKNLFLSIPDFLKSAFENAINFITEKLQFLLDKARSVIDFVKSPLDAVSNVAGGAVDSVRGFFSNNFDKIKNFVAGGQAIASPQTIAPASNVANNSSIQQTNGDVNITISGVSEPQKAADLIALKQNEVNINSIRNLRRGVM